MPNNKPLACLLVSSTIFTATALAQVAPETPSLIDESESATEPADAGLTTEAKSEPEDPRDSPDLERSAAATTATPDTKPDLLVQGDDYRPSERVSEDRSISFPVDI